MRLPCPPRTRKNTTGPTTVSEPRIHEHRQQHSASSTPSSPAWATIIAAATVRARFFGFAGQQHARGPTTSRARSRLPRSSTLGSSCPAPRLGRPCHCLAAIHEEDQTDHGASGGWTASEAPKSRVASRPSTSSTTTLTTGEPEHPPEGEGHTVTAREGVSEDADHGDDRHRAEPTPTADGSSSPMTFPFDHMRGGDSVAGRSILFPGRSPRRFCHGYVRLAMAATAPTGRRPLVFASLAGYQRNWFRQRSGRGPDGVGRAGARRAGVRVHRGGVAGGRAVRRPACPCCTRRSGALATWWLGPMSATAALSAAAVADLTTGGPDQVLAFTGALAPGHGRAGAGGRVAAARVPGQLHRASRSWRNWFIGLALTIVIGQVPKLLGVEKEEGDFFEQLWGVVDAPRRHPRPHVPWLGAASLAIVIGLRRLAGGGTRFAGGGRLRRGRGAAVRPGRRGSGPSSATSTAVCPRYGLPDALGFSRLPRSVDRRRRPHARRLRRRPRRGQDLRRRASTTRSTPTASSLGLGRRQPRRRACAPAWSSTAACPRRR